MSRIPQTTVRELCYNYWDEGGGLLDKKTSLILGSLFILSSGLIFTIERLTAYVYWSAQINTGEWDTTPQTMPLSDNLFTGLFFLVGIVLIIISFKKER